MHWIDLHLDQQIQEIKDLSETRVQVIFKHSTRCSISSMAKSRLERKTQPENTDFYFLDLIKNRSLSNQISETFSVAHESPQVLVIKKRECVYDESHSGIDMDDITTQAAPN